MKKNSLQVNASGCSDPTAYTAIVRADKLDNSLINKVLEDIFKICKDNNLYIYGEVAFVDRTNNKKARRKLYYHPFVDNRKEK